MKKKNVFVNYYPDLSLEFSVNANIVFVKKFFIC
jgi:hypothetical protein